MTLLKRMTALHGLLLGSNTVPTKSSILSSLVVVAVALAQPRLTPVVVAVPGAIVAQLRVSLRVAGQAPNLHLLLALVPITP
jgi:hypothetical protein